MIDGGLRRLFQQHLPWVHWQAVETGMTGRGIPDLNYCARGVEGWVECKQTTGWAVGLRPEQVAWLARRTRAGGRCWVAVRRKCPAGPRRVVADELWLVPGTHVVPLHREGLRAVLGDGGAQGIWVGGPAAWDWREIAACLDLHNSV
jgi:hypothetical protein